MRQMIKGLVAALAVMAAGAAAPAMACGYGGCCGAVVSPCATTYAPTYSYVYGSGCGTCGNYWAHERLAEPTRQYYYVNQGPTFSGPGMFAPEPTYREDAVPAYGYHHHHAWHHRRHWGHEGYHYGHPMVRRSY
jgi:hypothetical protein